MSHVDQIKDRLSIMDVVGSYVKLEKAGSNLKALCPFHHEKTPSFFVSPSRNTFYCFGCGMKGDIFNFVESFEGLDFMGALKVLADRAHIDLDLYGPKKDASERERLYSCLNDAIIYFEDNLNGLKSKEALEYLYNRGLARETVKNWKIGYSPPLWHGLHEYLRKKKYTDAEIERAGLIKKAEKAESEGGRFYDRFRGRIMFPIADSSGRTVGFSGRILKDDGQSAKYLNSPETELFNKSKIVYGLDKAKAAIREKGKVVLVEGQMDIIMSHQAGVRNTVALSGTALTESHVELLRRFTAEIIFALDSDDAGLRATRRSAMMAINGGFEVRVALMPQGKDPADYIANNGSQWNALLDNSLNIIDFSLEKVLLSLEKGGNLVREIQENVFPYLFSLPSSMEKASYLKSISEKTGINEAAIIEDFKKSEKKFNAEQKLPETGNAQKSGNDKNINESRRYGIERRIWGIIFWQEALEEAIIDLAEAKKNFKRIAGDENFDKARKLFDSFRPELILEAEVLYKSANTKEELEELFINLEEDHLKAMLADQVEKLSKMEKAKKKGADEILRKCKELSERLSKLKMKIGNI